MRSTLIATASAVMLMAAPALAQTAPSAPSRTPDPNTSISLPAPIPQTPAPDPLKMEDVSKISGTAVYGSDDSKIGSVSTVLMNPESKTIDRLVVNSGGVLGVGGHKVAVPIDQLTWDSDKGAFKIAKTTDDVKSMPEWQSETARATTD
jgi:sporulation protein YlmC with PRC-barrel domain